jgi:hypothetical protein
MAPIRDRPLPIEIFDTPANFIPETDAVFLLGTSIEDRITHVEHWRNQATSTRFVQVLQQTRSDFTYAGPDGSKTILLRSDRQLKDFWLTLNSRSFYLDLTGFAHHVWAPLVRSCVQAGHRLMVIYVEPLDYRYNVTPTEGEIFDLSERIEGISPIPGFAALRESKGENVCFVPFLGFEGRRFAYVIEQVQPPGGKIVPIVGIPGFRPEFPFNAYLCNRPALLETRSWKNMRYAAANNPFSAYFLLEDIAAENQGDLLKIAPIGTKPHALGAVLYATACPQTVELVYDHPVRKARRTEGFARLLVYHVSAFLRA